LSVSLIGSLDNHVSVIDQVKIPVVWQLGDDVEVSLNKESESFVELSLGWLSLPFINIHDVPLLVDLLLVVVNNNVSVLRIGCTLHFNNFTMLVHNVSILISEHLPPSGVHTTGCSQVGASSVTLDFHSIALPVVVLDGLGDLIKVPLLSLDILSPSLKPDIVGTMALSNSLHWHSGSDVERSVDV
jgi:hypothetical protein